MNIKNAIVLVDQVGIETNDGLPPLEALLQATKSRIVPVVMASGHHDSGDVAFAV